MTACSSPDQTMAHAVFCVDCGLQTTTKRHGPSLFLEANRLYDTIVPVNSLGINDSETALSEYWL